MNRPYVFNSSIVAGGLLLLSGCTELFAVDFGNPAYVNGTNPTGGPPGAPFGDVITTDGDVSVSSNAGSGLQKHIRLNATSTADAFANFAPTPRAGGDQFLITFVGSKENTQTSVSFVEVYGTDDQQNEVRICSFAISRSSQGTGMSAWIYYQDGKSLRTEQFDNSALAWNVPHRVLIRIDRTNQQIYASVATEILGGAVVQSEIETAFNANFEHLSNVRGAAYGGSDSDYRIESLYVSAWSDSEQNYVVQTARQAGIIPPPAGRKAQATLTDERTLLDEALAASSKTLKTWLAPKAVAMVDKIRR